MKEHNKYEVFRCLTGIFFIFLLLWLTVSAPLVNASQQQIVMSELAEQEAGADQAEKFAGNNTPSTEERTESPPTFSEEYIHESRSNIYEIESFLQHGLAAAANGYRTPASELLSPPPEV